MSENGWHAEMADQPGWCGACSNRWPCAVNDLETERDRLAAENAELRAALERARVEHLYVGGDEYYSCELRGGQCMPPDIARCSCGADEHNAKIDAILAAEPDQRGVEILAALRWYADSEHWVTPWDVVHADTCRYYSQATDDAGDTARRALVGTEGG